MRDLGLNKVQSSAEIKIKKGTTSAELRLNKQLSIVKEAPSPMFGKCSFAPAKKQERVNTNSSPGTLDFSLKLSKVMIDKVEFNETSMFEDVKTKQLKLDKKRVTLDML